MNAIKSALSPRSNQTVKVTWNQCQGLCVLEELVGGLNDQGYKDKQEIIFPKNLGLIETWRRRIGKTITQ